MHFIDSQVSFFKSYLPSWRPERIKTFLAMIEAVIFSGKTSSTRMAAYCDRNASQKSLRRTIEKFYQFQEIDPKDIARLICAILGPMKLFIDRTNWKNGQMNINYLVLSVEINANLSIPLFWMSLDKAGNSNQNERCKLLGSFIETFGKEAIGSLSGDREFIGEQLNVLSSISKPTDLTLKTPILNNLSVFKNLWHS